MGYHHEPVHGSLDYQHSSQSENTLANVCYFLSTISPYRFDHNITLYRLLLYLFILKQPYLFI